MLTVVTYANTLPATAKVIKDVVSLDFSTNAKGGFIDATIGLSKLPDSRVMEFNFNNHLEIIDASGIVVWEGRVHSLTQDSGKPATFNINAVGYMANMFDLAASWTPKYNTNTEIAQIMRDGLTGYCNQLTYNSLSLPNTGRAIKFNSTNNTSVTDVVEELIKYGDASDRPLYYQVWNGRIFYLVKKPLPTDVYYETRVSDVDDFEAGTNGDNFYTRVTVKYKGANEVLTYTANNISAQNRYSTSFGSANPSASFIKMIREPQPIDVTNHGTIPESQAKYIADTMLNNYSTYGLRLTSSRIQTKRPDSIRLRDSKQPALLYTIRAGKYIGIQDMAFADTTVTGSNPSLFIGATKYSLNNKGEESLEIQSEVSTSAENVLSILIGKLPTPPE